MDHVANNFFLETAEGRSKLRYLIDNVIESKRKCIRLLSEHEQLVVDNKHHLLPDGLYTSSLIHFMHGHRAWRLSSGQSCFGQFFDHPVPLNNVRQIRYRSLRKADARADPESAAGSGGSATLYSDIEPDFVVVARLFRREATCQTMAEEFLWAFILRHSDSVADLNYFLDNPRILHLLMTLRYHGSDSETSWLPSALSRLKLLVSKKKLTSVQRMESIRKEYFTSKTHNQRRFCKFVMAIHELRSKAFVLAKNEVQDQDEPQSRSNSRTSVEPLIRLNEEYLMQSIKRSGWPCQSKIAAIYSDMLTVRSICMSARNLLQRQALRYFLREESLSVIWRTNGVALGDDDLKWDAFWDVGLLALKQHYLSSLNFPNMDASRNVEAFMEKLYKFFDLNYFFTDRRQVARRRFADLLNETLLNSNRRRDFIDFSAVENLINLLRNSKLRFHPSTRRYEDSTKFYLEICVGLIDFWKFTRSKTDQLTFKSRSTEIKEKLIDCLAKYFLKVQPPSPRLLEICLILMESDEHVAYTKSETLETLLGEHLRVHPVDVKSFELIFEYFPDNELIPNLLSYHPSHHFVLEYCRRLVPQIDENLNIFEFLFTQIYQYLDFASNGSDKYAWRLAHKLAKRLSRLRIKSLEDGLILRLKNFWLARSDWWPKFYLNDTRYNSSFDDRKGPVDCGDDGDELISLKRSVMEHCKVAFED